MADTVSRLAWQRATVVKLIQETSAVMSLVLEVPGWTGHRAGQHVDVRLTAADGYQAERSYSIASAPAEHMLTLTIERLDDGEVSPYLTDELAPGDQLELRIQQDAAALKWLIINRERNEHLHTLDTTFGNSDVR